MHTQEETQQGLIPSISIEGLLTARDGAVEAFRRARRDLNAAKEALAALDVDFPRIEVQITYGDLVGLDEADEIREELDRSAWSMLFAKSGVRDLMSGQKRHELSGLLHQSRHERRRSSREDGGRLPELTEENIRATFEELYKSRGDMLLESIEAIYKRMSWDYKTNQPTRFGEKIILTYALSVWSNQVGLNHDSVLYDLERLLCIIDRQLIPTYDVGLSRALRNGMERGELYEIPGTSGASLFSLRGFKNHNAHVYVRPDLVAELNRRLAAKYPKILAGSR